ncbi:MAG: D-alanine--D-alanine ligase [Candidatus Babeliaceae bacterium]
MLHKLKIGVLIGGKSIEREVSLNSGRTICDHLDTTRYDIIPLFQTLDNKLYILPWRFLYRGKISDFEHRLADESQQIVWDEVSQLVDLLYIALHGRYGEDGSLQGMLEVLKIPYVGSKIFASALGMDKIMQKYFLSAAGISIPRFIALTPDEIIFYEQHILELEDLFLKQHLIFPCIIKPHQEGSSLGISVVNNFQELLPALKYACSINSFKNQSVLIEEYVEGMEFSCIVITDEKNHFVPLSITEIVKESHTSFYDYAQKYMPGRATKFTPARCSLEQQLLIQNTCIQVMHALRITTIGRIDGFLTKDNRVIITDPNTFSGMGPASFAFLQAAEHNMSHTQFINHLIETELRNYHLYHTATQKNAMYNETFPQKIRVGVLLGGNSNEKEISLESGRNIVYKLSPHKYEPIPLFVNSVLELYRIDQKLLVRNSTHEIESALSTEQKIGWHALNTLVDFVFIGLHGGIGENGALQGMLEIAGIPYNGSGVLTSALCMDKYQTNQFLKSQNFAVPHSFLLPLDDEIKLTQAFLKEKQLTFPLIVKPHDDGCSVLVHKADTLEELHHACNALKKGNKKYALIEEYIKGMELTVCVIGNAQPQALIPSQAVAQKGILSIEEKFLPGAGENQTPAPLSLETLHFVQKTMEQVYKALGCKGYARIDCFYQSAQQSPTGSERVIILEVNTLPGLTPATCIFHQAAELGIKPMDFIDHLIQLGFEEHQKTVEMGAFQDKKREISSQN